MNLVALSLSVYFWRLYFVIVDPKIYSSPTWWKQNEIEKKKQKPTWSFIQFKIISCGCLNKLFKITYKVVNKKLILNRRETI